MKEEYTSLYWSIDRRKIDFAASHSIESDEPE